MGASVGLLIAAYIFKYMYNIRLEKLMNAIEIDLRFLVDLESINFNILILFIIRISAEIGYKYYKESIIFFQSQFNN